MWIVGLCLVHDIDSGEFLRYSCTLPHHECILCILGDFHAEGLPISMSVTDRSVLCFTRFSDVF